MIFNLSQISDISKEIVEKYIKVTNEKSANTIALFGDLGAGKTTLVKEICKNIEVKQEIISPTFVIMKNYKIDFNGFKNLIHIDAYRLKSEKEIEKLGFLELIKNKENLIFIEWPEIIEKTLPEKRFNIYLKHINDDEREISIS